MLLLTLYSISILIIDLISLQFKLILSFIKASLRIIKSTRLKSLAGEKVLITGAAHGIGRELALILAEHGAIVALWDINASLCEQTARDVRAKGGKAVSYYCDISDRSHVLETALKVKKEIGTISILINNAGIVQIQSLLNHGPQQIRRVFDVNVISHFWTLEAFLPDMIAANRGHVTAIGSMTSLVGSANLVPYSASKFAVRGLMQALAEELKEDARKPYNIHLTTVHPYIVNTGQVQRPRLRFPSLLGVQKPSHAAQMIIKAIRQNKTEVSVPSWLLPLHDITRALPEETFSLMKDFMDSGAEAHCSAWVGDAPHQAAMAVLNKKSGTIIPKTKTKNKGHHLSL